MFSGFGLGMCVRLLLYKMNESFTPLADCLPATNECRQAVPLAGFSASSQSNSYRLLRYRQEEIGNSEFMVVGEHANQILPGFHFLFFQFALDVLQRDGFQIFARKVSSIA